jgi:hypothetical protein
MAYPVDHFGLDGGRLPERFPPGRMGLELGDEARILRSIVINKRLDDLSRQGMLPLCGGLLEKGIKILNLTAPDRCHGGE